MLYCTVRTEPCDTEAYRVVSQWTYRRVGVVSLRAESSRPAEAERGQNRKHQPTTANLHVGTRGLRTFAISRLGTGNS